MSEDLRQSLPANLFWLYYSTFDAVGTIRAHAMSSVEAVPGHRTNFLGVSTNLRSFFPTLRNVPDGVEGLPLPANWHADIAEWAAVLRAVDLADETFVMAELGCGWGCWMNNSGAAARRRNKTIFLIGVEGDESHLDFAREAMRTNKFQGSQYKLHRGVAAGRSGVALFPRQETGGVSWSSEPVFLSEEDASKRTEPVSEFEQVRMLTLDELFAGRSKIDLLHLDIQGGEADLIASSLDVIRHRVAYIVVGTHSRPIEGRIIELLEEDGWVLEIERPAIFDQFEGRKVLQVDGVQGWRNCRFGPQ